MKLLVAALDYDGTIASDGVLHAEVRAAIEHVRARGLLVVLVTGRRLRDLRRLLGAFTLFDAIVGENGAVVVFPASGRLALLAPAAPRAFLDELARRGVPAQVGQCVVEFDAAASVVVLDVVRELELPLTLHFNRGRLMVLPQAVSKATGLLEALRTLRRSSHNAIAVGDAENDHELLRAAEIGVAVAWGSAALQAAADVVLPGTGPGDVARYLREAGGMHRILAPKPGRRRVVLGRDSLGQPVSLAERGRNVLIAGDSGSGKSWVAGLMCEQLIVQQYCTFVLDPEGDYLELESLPGVTVLGRDDPPPSMPELERALRHADVSIVVDLTHLDLEQKRAYTRQAVRTVTTLRRETGLPHRIVVDEAHYFLHNPAEAAMLDAELAGHTLVTFRVAELHADVLRAAECIIVTRETELAEVAMLHRMFATRSDLRHWEETLGSLEIDEAVLLPVSEEAGGTLLRFQVAPRLTRHVRHRHKYLDVAVAADRSFHFRDAGGGGPVATSLQEFSEGLGSVPPECIDGHARRGDFSRWIHDVVRDPDLAAAMRELEEQQRSGAMIDFGSAAMHAIRMRYDILGEPI